VGTVVELFPSDGVEVEFLDRDGKTGCVATFAVTDMLVLNRDQRKSRDEALEPSEASGTSSFKGG
jgi:hypothetical protein